MSKTPDQKNFQYKQDKWELSHYCSPEDIINEVNNLKNKYPEAKDLELDSEDYYGSIQIYFSFNRLETINEQEERFHRFKRNEEWERQRYEELKKKFESS